MPRHLRIPWGIALAGVAVGVGVPAVYARLYSWGAIGGVFDDVVARVGVSRLMGLMSDLGVALWVTMAILLLHGWHRLVQDRVRLCAGDHTFYFLHATLIMWLAVDDRLLIHESLSRLAPEAIILAVYGGMLMGLIAIFHRYWRSATWGWLGVAAVCLGISFIADTSFAEHLLGSRVTLHGLGALEEGAKWFGIVGLLLAVFVLVSHPPYAAGDNRHDG